MHALKDAQALRHLLTLAVPIVVSRSSQTVIGFSDAAMVARLGEDALAATSTGAMDTYTVLILPMGMAFIVSSYASQLTGEGRHGAARRYGWYGLGIAALAMLAALVSIPLVPTAVGMLGMTPGVSAPLTSYLQIRLLSGGAAIGMEALANYYGGLGNTRLPMVAGVVAMVVTVFFNWVLIYGNLGAPALGVAGSAWASNIGSVAGFLVVMVCFWRGVGAATDKVEGRLSWAEFGTMLKVGLPSGLNWFMEFAAFAVFINVMVGSLGTTALAAMMAVMQLCSVSFMPAFGLASAGAIVTGQNLGAKNVDEVPRNVARTAALAVLWQGTCAVVYFLFPERLLSLFVAPGAEASALVVMGSQMLVMASLWQVFDALAAVIAESLRAAGDTAFTLWARVIISWGIIVPGGYIHIMRMGGQHQAAMVWIIFYLAALAAVLFGRFQGGKWRTLNLTAAVGHG